MATVVLTLLIVALAILAMAVGVLLGRPPIRRGCGSPSGLPGLVCFCSNPCDREKRNGAEADESRRPVHPPISHAGRSSCLDG